MIENSVIDWFKYAKTPIVAEKKGNDFHINYIFSCILRPLSNGETMYEYSILCASRLFLWR